MTILETIDYEKVFDDMREKYPHGALYCRNLYYMEGYLHALMPLTGAEGKELEAVGKFFKDVKMVWYEERQILIFGFPIDIAFYTWKQMTRKDWASVAADVLTQMTRKDWASVAADVLIYEAKANFVRKSLLSDDCYKLVEKKHEIRYI